MSKKTNEPLWMQPPYMETIGKGNKARLYMNVQGRLMWYRAEHPEGVIETKVINCEPVIIIQATVYAGDAKAEGMATVRSGKGTSWEGRDVEKAETASIGRALAALGYGTQFAFLDMQEGDYLADSPVDNPQEESGVNPNTGLRASAYGKSVMWDKIKTNKDVRAIYKSEQYLKNTMALYQGDVMLDGFDRVVQWLLTRERSSEEGNSE